LSILGTEIQPCPRRVVIRTPPVVPWARAVSNETRAALSRVLRSATKLRAVARHPDCRVVHVAVLLEIGGQVVVGIAPAVRPGHPDLAAAEGLAQGFEHAQLVGDPLHLAFVVDHRLAPLRRHYPGQRHPIGP
jgi:hypothetical protein